MQVQPFYTGCACSEGEEPQWPWEYSAGLATEEVQVTFEELQRWIEGLEGVSRRKEEKEKEEGQEEGAQERVLRETVRDAGQTKAV